MGKYALKQYWYNTRNTKSKTGNIHSKVIQTRCTTHMEFTPKTNKNMQHPYQV